MIRDSRRGYGGPLTLGSGGSGPTNVISSLVATAKSSVLGPVNMAIPRGNITIPASSGFVKPGLQSTGSGCPSGYSVDANGNCVPPMAAVYASIRNLGRVAAAQMASAGIALSRSMNGQAVKDFVFNNGLWSTLDAGTLGVVQSMPVSNVNYQLQLGVGDFLDAQVNANAASGSRSSSGGSFGPSIGVVALPLLNAGGGGTPVVTGGTPGGTGVVPVRATGGPLFIPKGGINIPVGGQIVPAAACPSGYTQDANGNCVPVLAPSPACPPGYYQDQNGNCAPAGTYSTSGGGSTVATAGGSTSSAAPQGCPSPYVDDGNGNCVCAQSGYVDDGTMTGNCIPDPTLAALMATSGGGGVATGGPSTNPNDYIPAPPAPTQDNTAAAMQSAMSPASMAVSADGKVVAPAPGAGKGGGGLALGGGVAGAFIAGPLGAAVGLALGWLAGRGASAAPPGGVAPQAPPPDQTTTVYSTVNPYGVPSTAPASTPDWAALMSSNPGQAQTQASGLGRYRRYQRRYYR